jgi:hypothetical protein
MQCQPSTAGMVAAGGIDRQPLRGDRQAAHGLLEQRPLPEGEEAGSERSPLRGRLSGSRRRGCRGCGPAGQGPAWAARPGRPRQRPVKLHLDKGLRQPALPAGATPTWHYPQDHLGWHRVEPEAGPASVCDGAFTGVADGLPAAAGPLPAAHRYPARVRAAGLRVDLPQPPELADGRNRAFDFATRSIWTRSRRSCWPSPTKPCSQRRRPYGSDQQHRPGPTVHGKHAEPTPTRLTLACHLGT